MDRETLVSQKVPLSAASFPETDVRWSLADIQRSVAAHRAAPTPCLLPTTHGTYDRRRLDFLEEHDCEPGARFASEKLPPQFWARLGREYWCTGCGLIKRTAEGRT